MSVGWEGQKRRAALIVAIALVAGGSASGASGENVPVAAAGVAARAVSLSRHAIPVNAGWRAYDETPAKTDVAPVRVLRVTGDVTGAQALAHPGTSARTTLTDRPGRPAPSLVLDFGQEVGGIAQFDVASTTGTTLAATYSETLRNLGNDGAATVTVFAAGNGQRSDTFTIAKPGLIKAALIQGGERYERLTLTAPGRVTLRGAGIRFTPPRIPPRGTFLSSDRLLNRIWWAGAYTLALNQMTPATTVEPGAVNRLHLILDGAKRDRAVWSGDHVISDLTDYYASDPAYARDSIALFLEHPASIAASGAPAVGVMSKPGPLPGACSPNPRISKPCVTWSATYSMLVMTALANLYRYTGDLAFVAHHWPAVVRQVAWDAQQVDANGLFAVTGDDGADWNVENISGELTYVNAVYVQALHSAEALARALGHRARARMWSAVATAVSRAVNRALWNPTTGVYDASTSARGSVVQDANVTAILAGIAGRSRARQIVIGLGRALASPFGPLDAGASAPASYTRDVSPYMGSFAVLAAFAAGDEPGALAIIRREWGYMVSHDPGGTDWERIERNGVPAGGGVADSTAHAWSTGPTPALSQYVLGVTPASPGFRTWSVAPGPGSLSWAQGTVPTPHGPLTVRWRRVGRRALVITVHAPRHASGTVAIPVVTGAVIARDGHVIWSHGRAARGVRARRTDGAVLVPAGPGTTTLAAVG